MNENNYNIIASSLKQFDEVKSIYVNSIWHNGKKIINCNVVCDMENITENRLLCQRIIANLEMMRALFEKTNIILNYSIKALDIFKEDMEEPESETYQEYVDSIIIYSNESNNNRQR